MGVCGLVLTTRRVRTARLAVAAGRCFSAVGSVFARGLAFAPAFGADFLGVAASTFGDAAGPARASSGLGCGVSLAGGVEGALRASAVSRLSSLALVASGVAGNGVAATSGSGDGSFTSVGAGASGAICCGNSSGAASTGLGSSFAPPGAPRGALGGATSTALASDGEGISSGVTGSGLASASGGTAGTASNGEGGAEGTSFTSGSAEVVAGSATGLTKAIAGGALLPGPGKVIRSGSIAAIQSPCTAPAPSTQSGRVIERLSVKGAASGAPPHFFAPSLPLS